MADVFISYSRKDGDFVRGLGAALVERDFEVWIDFDDIPPTATWRGEISDAISASDVVVFVLTPASLTSRECELELDAAFAQNKRVIPLMRAEPDGAPVPERLAEVNWIRATPDDDLGVVLDTLVEAMRTDLAWVRAHTRLLVRAREWDANGRDRAYLLSRQDLRDAEAALGRSGTREPAPTELQREYVAAGRAAAERRQRVVLAGVSTALIVAIGLAVLAFIQRGVAITERQQAQSRQLAADAALNEQSDPELSLLLAIQAARVTPTSEATSSLREALVRSPLRATLQPTLDGESASLSPDGRYALTFGRRLKLWNVQTGRAVLTFPDVGDAIREPAQFTPDGRRLVVGQPGGSVAVWDLRTRKRVALMPGEPGTPVAIAASADGRLVAMGETHGAFVEPIGAGRPVPLRQTQATEITSIAFAPDGRTIGGASPRGAELWRTADGHQLEHLPLNLANAAPTISFVAGGRELALRALSLWIWNLRTARLIGEWSGAADVSPDGSRVAQVTADFQHIKVVDLRNGGTLTITDPGQPLAVRFSPTGQVFASADADLSFRVYNASDGSDVTNLIGPVVGGPTDVQFSGDSERLITANAYGTVRVWQVFTPSRVLAAGGYGSLFASGGSALMLHTRAGLEVLRDGRMIVLPGSGSVVEGTARIDAAGRVVVGLSHGDVGDAAGLWHVGGGGAITLVPASRNASAVALSSDGRTVATVTAGGRVVLWDAASARMLRALGAAGRNVLSAGFSDDGKSLVTGGGGSAARLWPLTGAGRPVKLPAGWPALSPDGKLVLLTSDPTSWLDRVTGGTPVARLATPSGASGEFSPDGRLVVTAGQDSYARVFTSDGHPIAQLQHHDAVDRASFSPNSEYLITTSNDGYARVWESVTGQLLMSVPISFYHASATFAPDSRTFLVDGPGGVTQYDCEVCQPLPALLRLAATRVTRSLTQAERDRYLGSLPAP